MFKIPVSLSAISLLMFAAVAQGGMIRCGEQIFQDGMEDPPTRPEVLDICGKPFAQSYGTLEYKDPGGETVKVLHFDDAGELVFISEHEL
jgi:hypothetical protein